MNSLEQLNGFGQSSIVFEDPQATPSFGTFVDDGLPNKTGFATEDSWYTVGDHPFGGNFVGAVGLDNTTNNWIQVEISVTGGVGTEYYFEVPELKRNISYIVNGNAVEYNYIQTNVDMHYMINNTRVYLKNAPDETSSPLPDTVITISVKWDQSGTPQPNIKSQATILTVTELPELDSATIGNRTYIANQFNLVFNSNPPTILDENFYAPDYNDVEYNEGDPTNPEQYAFKITSNVGTWKEPTASMPYPNTITVFGSKESISTQLQNIVFVPDLGSTATATVTYGLYVPNRGYDPATDVFPLNWIETADGTFDITGSARTAPASWEGDFNENDTITVTEEMILFSLADVLVVGGGGGGGAISTRTQLTANEDGLTGGGGGSGYFFEMQGSDLLQQANLHDQITMIRGIGGLGANWDTTTIPTNGGNSEILINGSPVVTASGGGRGGSSYNAPNQPYGLGTPTTAFVEYDGANGGMGGGAAGSNFNMPGYSQTYGGTGGVGFLNTLTTSGGVTQSTGLNGDNGAYNGSNAYEAGGGGGTPTTGGSSTVPSGPVITSQIVNPGIQFCEHAPAGGLNINQFNPTQYLGSGGKGMGYDYFSSVPRPYWNAQDGHNGIVIVRIRQA